MNPDLETLHCVIMRGGTSKGIFLRRNELPADPAERDAVIRAVFGSPDPRQIDGLGGAEVLTSKLAIIGQSTRADADVDYTFAQVGIDSELVNFNASCGNIASAVGPYAVDEGYVSAVEPIARVRVHLTNTDTVLLEEVPVRGGKACTEGDYAIDGCPGTGARISEDWALVVKQKPECVLPTGNVVDTLEVEGKQYHATITGIGNAVLFLPAQELGMQGTESAADIGADKALMDRLEKIRSAAAVRLGMVEKPEDAVKITPYQPFIAAVALPRDYQTPSGRTVSAADYQILSRLVFMQKPHKAYPISAAVGIGAAARIPGTTIHALLQQQNFTGMRIEIGHPAGLMDVESAAAEEDGKQVFSRLAVFRTARRIMDGQVYIRKSVLNPSQGENYVG